LRNKIEELLKDRVNNDWCPILLEILDNPKMINNLRYINNLRKKTQVFPKKEDMFNAFKYTSFGDTKVVILGQDPYYSWTYDNKSKERIPLATGLAFDIPPRSTKIPPSLRNILAESKSRVSTLKIWAEKGVLLLNTALTVEINKPNSHKKIWENFTNEVIKKLNEEHNGLIFLLWGNNAKKYKKFIDNYKHDILEAVHPSPLSANKGFLGCGHFNKTNELLYRKYKKSIIW